MDESPFYITANENKEKALSQLNDAYKGDNNLVVGAINPTLINTDPNIDVRPHFHRLNYEKWRTGDAIPKHDSEVMRACRLAYEQVGLIRSVVDLMTEMAVEGLMLESPNGATDNFFKNWSKRVHLEDRAERFANHFLVEGNVVSRRQMGAIQTAEVRRMRRATAQEQEIEPGLIPIEYIFYDPSTIELIGGPLAIFSGTKQWAIVVDSRTLRDMVKVDKQDFNRLMSSLPEEIRELFKKQTGKHSSITGKFLIPIPSSRVYVAHNKKLDSAIWAKSFIFSILHDVIYNEKLRLAKISALDGWHNGIRLWRLGDHQAEILPSAGSFRKLADILRQHPGGILDILWDSMINMEAFYPPIEKLDNFNENFEAMMLGLGVPRILVGGSEGAGVTNMFVGMKNLMKRINGVRRAIIEWIDNEIQIISDNLGFRDRPTIRFSHQELFDPQTFYKLTLDLYDRGIISDVSILEAVGQNADIQRKLRKEEHDLRESGNIAPSNGPFWQPRIPQKNQDFQLERQEQNFDLQMKANPPENNQDEGGDQSNNNDQPRRQNRPRGRPGGSRDQQPRNRRFRSRAQLMMLADKIQDRIDEVVDSKYLVYNSVQNKRQLTNSQKQELEQAKLEILASAYSVDFDESSIDEMLTQADAHKVNIFISMYQDSIQHLGSDVTYQQLRMLKNQIFAEVHGGTD